jgi:cell division protein FtsN
MQAQATADPSVIVSSPRPSPRPRVMRVASAKTVATDARPVKAAAAEAPKAAPAVSKASGPQVQIGAFDSNAIATKEWNRLSGKFGGLFTDKGQVIQKHESNGRTFWRLRVAGFDSIGDARSFCASLKSGGTDCLALNQ